MREEIDIGVDPGTGNLVLRVRAPRHEKAEAPRYEIVVFGGDADWLGRAVCAAGALAGVLNETREGLQQLDGQSST